MPPKLTDHYKSWVCSCADGAMPKSETARCTDKMPGTHPPAWLPEERLARWSMTTWHHFTRVRRLMPPRKKGSEILFSVGYFCRETWAHILTRITEQTNGR